MTSTNFCTFCGKSLDAGAAFCGNCGSPVDDEIQPFPEHTHPQRTLTENPLAPLSSPRHNRFSRKPKTVIFTSALVLLAIILLTLLWNSTSEDERARQEQEQARLMLRSSDITESNFSTLCNPTDRCIGKFVVWTGIVQGNVAAGADEFLVKTFNGDANVETSPPLESALHEGDQVTFHGFVRELNAFLPDEIDTGYVRSSVTAQQIQAQQEAKQKQEDTQSASAMGVSLQDYLIGKDKNSLAHIACQEAVVNQDKWGGSSSVLDSDYSWRIDAKTITISGHDVRLKNGFNAERLVSYDCLYDLSSESAMVEDIQ